MKCYGYDRNELEKNAENDTKLYLHELSEVSLVAKPEQLRLIANFLNNAANQIELNGTNFGHEHFRDYINDFKEGDADIIICKPASDLTSSTFKQKAKKWEMPFEYCNRISMGLLKDDGNLTINLCDVSTDINHHLELIFEDFVAYKSTNESYLNNFLTIRTKEIGFTFTIENSDWIIEMMNDPIFQDHAEGIEHYVIATLDECVEILAQKPPKIQSNYVKEIKT